MGLRQHLGWSRPLEDLSRFEARLQAIGAMEVALRRLTDDGLRQRSADTVRAAARLDASQRDVTAFALVREWSRRLLGQRPFDIQILGGLALLDGHLIEMQTGEGKTLGAVAPAVTHAAGGRGVHILTFNDYLARRDAEWMGPVYRALGLCVGFVQDGMPETERRAAYEADVTYVTAKEAGFDFLRDGLVLDAAERVHGDLDVAIVDEADSILIDEARIPLVIAGSVAGDDAGLERLAALVSDLSPGGDYELDPEHRTVHLTDRGLDHAETRLGGVTLHDEANLPLLSQLHAALYAGALMRRDVDYIVRSGRVEIVDEFTGRVVEDRHWPDGLQAAIEAKEGLHQSGQGQVLGQITVQHFLHQYRHLSGMTATAAVAARELLDVYGLEVKVIPPNKPCRRVDHPDLVFTDRATRRAALIDEIRSVHAEGRPILVGTSSVAESESLTEALREAGVDCTVLNARHDREEAQRVAEAGRPGAVTISTNMAGRGTDIRLGGADEADRDVVVGLGGLYVIGTQRHESRRIDDQLCGRSGRQGDPGSSRFILSLDDELMETYDLRGLVPSRRWPLPQPTPIDEPSVLREMARVQRIAEGQSYDVRDALLRYSEIVDAQRRIVHDERRQVLCGEDTAERHDLDRFDPETASRLARRLRLLAIDAVWAEHLAFTAEIREGIHLVGVGGMTPLDEFVRQVTAAFQDLDERIQIEWLRRCADLPDRAEDIDWHDQGLRGPASTWTYLVEDDVFENRIAAALVGNRDIGFSSGAALLGPLLALWAILRRRQRRR